MSIETFRYMENPWVSIFETSSERVVHAKVVSLSHTEEIAFEHKCNIIEMTRRRELEVVEGKDGCVWRGSCVPPKSLKAVGSWKQKTRVTSLIKIGIKIQLVLPHQEVRLGLMINIQIFFLEFRMIIIIFTFPGIRPNFCLFVVPELLKSFFLLFGELTTDFNSRLEARSRSNPSPLPPSPTSVIRKYTWDKNNPKKSIVCPIVKLRLETVAPNPNVQ